MTTKARLPVTPGEWRIDTVMFDNYPTHTVRAPFYCEAVHHRRVKAGYTKAERDQHNANAVLIADAGTTYNKIHLLPSEMAEKLEAAELILKRVQELSPTARCGFDDHIMDVIMTDVSTFLRSLRPTPQTNSEG